MTFLSQSRPQPSEGESAKLNPLFRFISYRNVGFLTAFLDFFIIVATSLIAGVSYDFFVLGPGVADLSALLAVGVNSAFLFVLLTKSRGFTEQRPSHLAGDNSTGLFLIGSWCYFSS